MSRACAFPYRYVCHDAIYVAGIRDGTRPKVAVADLVGRAKVVESGKT